MKFCATLFSLGLPLLGLTSPLARPDAEPEASAVPEAHELVKRATEEVYLSNVSLTLLSLLGTPKLELQLGNSGSSTGSCLLATVSCTRHERADHIPNSAGVTSTSILPTTFLSSRITPTAPTRRTGNFQMIVARYAPPSSSLIAPASLVKLKREGRRTTAPSQTGRVRPGAASSPAAASPSRATSTPTPRACPTSRMRAPRRTASIASSATRTTSVSCTPDQPPRRTSLPARVSTIVCR